MNVLYINALILGLASSLHCLGMCGPLVMVAPIKDARVQSQLMGMLEYLIGKTSTYALLGITVGIIGLSAQVVNWMNYVSIACGILIILFAWNFTFKLPFTQRIQQLFLRISGKLIGKLLHSTIPFKAFLFGSINGFLPCGLVYIALVNSLLAETPVQAAIAMAFFGLGTAPVLLAVRMIGTKIKFNSSKITPIIVTIVGLLIILRGLNLGIPYISPKTEISQSNTAKKEVVMTCCTSKTACTK